MSVPIPTDIKSPEEPEQGVKLLEQQPRPGASSDTYPKSRRPFSKLTTELEPKDLTQEGVQKMILGEIARLETEVSKLQQYEESFHASDKQCAVLNSKLKRDTTLEILYTIAIAVGSALLGLIPSLSNINVTIVLVVLAVALVLFALIAKWKGGKE